jgi:hypothetical protein
LSRDCDAIQIPSSQKQQSRGHTGSNHAKPRRKLYRQLTRGWRVAEDLDALGGKTAGAKRKLQAQMGEVAEETSGTSCGNATIGNPGQHCRSGPGWCRLIKKEDGGTRVK